MCGGKYFCALIFLSAMDEWARDRVTTWRDEPFEGGVSGLHSLADDGFTGALEAGNLMVMMLNGRILGHWGGELASIPSTGTVYHAPDTSLPLLFTMLAMDSNEEGQYYTEQTSLTSVHESLVDAGFVGYLLLSEHVLSGDYYIVYYGDKALPVAFIGTSQRCVTGDEAFDLAADEVGLYEVQAVDLEVEELPPLPTPVVDDAETESASSPDVDTDTPGSAVATDDSSSGETESIADEEPDDVQAALTDTVAEDTGAEAGETSEDTTDGPAPDEEIDAKPADVEEAVESTSDTTEPDEPDTQESDTPADEEDTGQDGASEEPTEVMPSPEADEEDETDATADETPEQAVAAEGDEESAATDDGDGADHVELPRGIEINTTSSTAPETALEPEEVAELERERDALIERVYELESTRDDLEATLAEITDEQTQLTDTVESLRAELMRLETEATQEASTPEVPDRSIAAEDALAQTHLFVRYHSNDGPTLASIGERSVTKEAILENLILEGHTEFDSEAVGVDGQRFEAFLDDRLETRFARWLVEELPFKVHTSNERAGLRTLLDGLRHLDRIDFNHHIEQADEHRFDVVARDRVGKPLIVASVDPGRQATTVDTIRELLDASTDLAKATDTFVAALLVTESFFESPVIEAADEATSTGLLSRSDKLSYVHVSRSVGYHLCLVEYRSDAAHVTKPAL